ncbi:insulinase family protein [Candidatus Woesearchaeota archaeon]|nr:insulinase family protein [Candidatus Woesearchaeota archaeon]
MNDIIQLKNTFYVPNAMVIAVSGAVEPTRCFSEIEKTFGTLEAKDVCQPVIEWKFQPGTTYVEFDDLKDKQKPEQDQALVYLV